MQKALKDPDHSDSSELLIELSRTRDRSLVYGNGLKVAQAQQPGTSGPFSFEKPPKFLSGGGGLVSTAGDYMRFCLMLSGMGEFGGKRLLKKVE